MEIGFSRRGFGEIIHIEGGGYAVDVLDSNAVREDVLIRVLAFCAECRAWSGEVAVQSDRVQLDAAEFLGKLLDEVIKPRVTIVEE